MFKKKKKEKVPYLNDDAVICSLAVVKKTGDKSFESVHYGVSVGEVKEINEDGNIIKFIEDSLVDDKAYVILSELEVEKSIRNGDLFVDEPYCYSMYHKNHNFDLNKIFKLETKEEIINYLIEYNKKNNTTLYWTFLDDEQRKEVDNIKVNNDAKYLEFNY